MRATIPRSPTKPVPEIGTKRPASTSPISFVGLLITVSAVALSFFSIYAFFILLFGLLPGFIATIVDRDPHKYLTKIVFPFNLAGIAPYIAQIALHPITANEVAIKYILDPNTWFYIYFYSALGWIIFWCFPNTNILVKSITIQFKVFELTNELNKLTEEWGEEIKRKPGERS